MVRLPITTPIRVEVSWKRKILLGSLPVAQIHAKKLRKFAMLLCFIVAKSSFIREICLPTRETVRQD